MASTQLTYAQLIDICYRAGFRGDDLIAAVAIAMRESGGRPRAYNGNANTGDQSYGLFQINMLGRMGPSRRGTFGIATNEELYDPDINARAAYMMYVGRGSTFYDWGGYKGMSHLYSTNYNTARANVMSAVQMGRLPADWQSRSSAPQVVHTGYAKSGGTYSSSSSGGRYGSADTMERQAEGRSYGPDAVTEGMVPSSGGGGGSGGGARGAGGGTGLGPGASAEAIVQWVRENFPSYMAWIQHPEVGWILMQAAVEGWDSNRLLARLQQTNWWQTTSLAQRQAEVLRASDPAEWNRIIEQRTREVLNLAGQLGANVNIDNADDIAVQAQTFGWSDEQLRAHLVFNFTTDQSSAGMVGASSTQVNELSRSFLVSVTDAERMDWARKVTAGELSWEGVQQLLRARAKARFAGNAELVALIDQGVAPNDYFGEHRAVLAQELELDQDSIDLRDTRWASILSSQRKDGAIGPMSVPEAQRWAWSQPEHFRTARGRDNLTSTALGVLGALGVRGV